ncbi:MAG: phosphate ABC transporter substrate-binding/OmpA family protein [Chromatiaceae bacterium]|nr:phosphate ABC transporter substrate-binding/OmpA family protein [Chromatiaceae bacterium]
MSPHVKAAALILVLGLAGILGARYLLPILQDTRQRETSDASATRGTLVVGTDNWIGYFPLCSDPMAKRMRQSGWILRCENDNADYQARFERLKSGEIQFAVATVDSYLLSGAPLGFPGTIVAVIDESKGGDAILARAEVAANLDGLRQASDIKVAFTPASPSEHLLRAIRTHFDIPFMQDRRGRWRVETDGSSAALEKLLDGEVGAAVLWEPDVSRALAKPGIVKLIGTEDTERLIVDILLVGRRFSREHPEAVAALLDSYFETLKLYRDRPGEMEDDVMKATGLSREQVRAMLRGVSWTTLGENAVVWFGISGGGPFADEGLEEAIRGAIRILTDSGDLDGDPLPDGDPYRITNRQFVADLSQRLGATAGEGGDRTHRFPPLDDAGWGRLEEIGSLKMEPIGFRRGTADLAYEGKLELDRLAERLVYYPNFRILVKGHTGIAGDPRANLELSQDRAEAVARYLMVTYGIDANRLRILGYGSSRPLPRLPGESDRAYGYRLPRVEVTLAAENL